MFEQLSVDLSVCFAIMGGFLIWKQTRDLSDCDPSSIIIGYVRDIISDSCPSFCND